MVGSRKAHTTLAHSSSAGELNPLPASPPGHMPALASGPVSSLTSGAAGAGGGGGHHHSHHSHHSHHHSSSQSSCQRQINSTSLGGSVSRLNLVQQTTRGDSGPGGGGQHQHQHHHAQQQQQQQQPGASVNIPKHLNELFGVSPSDIDKYSRVVFPVCFVCFNLMYWMIYLHISKILEDDFVVLNAD